jgi:hypothetical protein
MLRQATLVVGQNGVEVTGTLQTGEDAGDGGDGRLLPEAVGRKNWSKDVWCLQLHKYFDFESADREEKDKGRSRLNYQLCCKLCKTKKKSIRGTGVFNFRRHLKVSPAFKITNLGW